VTRRLCKQELAGPPAPFGVVSNGSSSEEETRGDLDD
jgi:hypothetical protein